MPIRLVQPKKARSGCAWLDVLDVLDVVVLTSDLVTVVPALEAVELEFTVVV